MKRARDGDAKAEPVTNGMVLEHAKGCEAPSDVSTEEVDTDDLGALGDQNDPKRSKPAVEGADDEGERAKAQAELEEHAKAWSEAVTPWGAWQAAAQGQGERG